LRALSIIWSGLPGFAQDLEVRSEIAFTNFDFWSTLDENFLIHFQKLECESFVMSHNLINQIIGVMLRLRRALRKMNCVSCEIAIFSQSQFAIFRNPFYNPVNQKWNWLKSKLQKVSYEFHDDELTTSKFLSWKIFWKT